jgi:hypothetical protein
VRALVVVTDSEAVKEFERAFIESGDRGFTIVPRVFGRGRTGLRTGDRVHPGGSALFFTVVADADATSTLTLLKDVRDRAGAREVTKIFALPAEDVS